MLASLRGSSSVSSVQTLEEAKVTRGCLYMAMPVQEVSDVVYTRHMWLILVGSTEHCNGESSMKYKQRDTRRR
jgi:hypothetical protein